MNRRGKAAALLLVMLGGMAATAPVAAQDQPVCPAEVAGAERLVLVLGSGLDARAATVRFMERRGERWHASGEPKAAALGVGGMAWSWAAKAYAPSGERVKIEGDKRTPAGFFRLGKPFGFSARNVPAYVGLRPGQHYCVDDLHSPLYNTVVAKASAGEASGEDMAAIALYRQGLFVDYPTNREAKGGSCIFVHVRRSAKAGTVGCVALAERDVTAMQDWAREKPTVIGILPSAAWDRLRGCFPGL